MKRQTVVFSFTSEHFMRKKVGTVPPILVQAFARRYFQPLMGTLAEICQTLKSVWTEMFVCIWRHLEVKMTFIQLFYMDTNLKSRARGKRKIGVFRITSIASLEIGLTDRGTEFPVELQFCTYLFFLLMTNVLPPTDSILWVSTLVRRSKQTLER